MDSISSSLIVLAGRSGQAPISSPIAIIGNNNIVEFAPQGGELAKAA